MKLAVLAPVCWRTPPRHYGPWEQVASLIADGMVARGVDVTLFATGDSVTSGTLAAVCPTPYEEDRDQDAKVNECLHISHLMERADEFDLIHNHYDFLPLTYSRLIHTPMVTTIHGFSSPKIVPVYQKYNNSGYYVSISNADRNPNLVYQKTIYHGIDRSQFTFQPGKGDDLLFFGRIHPDKGTRDAIEIAQRTGRRLVICGIVQDQAYFETEIQPHIDNDHVVFLGSAGPQQRDELLGNARCLLHPIHFDEPFGLSVAEAMMCGTPVIAYNRGSMPELIQDGQSGYVVADVAAAVAAVARLDEIRPAECRHHAIARFGLERMLDEYHALYQEILTDRSDVNDQQ